ncbi:energy transducer TonB [Pontibacter russatus]|uniref:energy transducer TonB n=1 Tax=Pontibacter russatus TaxID=2694929 RepID=UPI00137AF7AB|nr:energy transducer TonB [Pontibacter russatus]
MLDITGPIVIEIPNLPKLPDEVKAEAAPAVEPVKQEKTEEFVKPKVVKENTKAATKTMPDQSELSKVHIGRNALDGEIPEFPSVGPDEAPAPGLGTGTGDPAAPTEFIHAEVMPEFTGGDDALFRYLGQNMRYPQAAQRAGIEGTVVVTFVVAPDGAITKAQVVKGLGYGTDEEALRVINNMPAWQPGRQNGRAVPVRYTIPIRFSLK